MRETSTGGDAWGGFSLSVSDFAWQTLVQSDALLLATHGRDWFKVALSFTATTSTVLVDAGYFGGSERRMTVCVDDLALFRKGANGPRINASLTPTALTGLTATQRFTLTGDDPDGAVERVLWDFGDSGRALAWTGERRVALPGVYTATVTAADDEGTVSNEHVDVAGVRPAGRRFESPRRRPTVRPSPPATLRLAGTTTGGVTEVLAGEHDRDVAVTAVGTASWHADTPLRPAPTASLCGT